MTNFWIYYNPLFILVSVVLFLVIAGYLFVSKFMQYRKRDTLVQIILIVVNSIWLASLLFQKQSATQNMMPLLNSINAFLNLLVPALWFMGTVNISEAVNQKKSIYLTLLIPLVLIILTILTNPLHKYLWGGQDNSHNIIYWLTNLYSGIFITIAAVIYMKNLALPFFIFRWQSFALLLSTMIPLTVIVVEKSIFYPLAYDSYILPYAFILSTWLIRLTRSNFNEKDIISVSRASFFENIEDAIILLNSESRIIDYNPAGALILSHFSKELKGRQIGEILPLLTDHVNRFSVDYKKINHISIEHTGKPHFYDIDIAPFVDLDGKLLSQSITLHDITERIEAEEALRKSEEKFRNIIKQSIDGIIIIDEEGRVIEWNNGMEKITGVKREETIEKPAWKIYMEHLLPPHQRDQNKQTIYNQFAQALASGDVEWFQNFSETYITHTDGAIRTIQQQVFPIKTSKGISLGSVIRDITENKQLETERIKSGKLESLGILAGGIAHDFNNILTAVIGNISLAKMWAKEERLSQLLGEAETASIQAKDLTQQLLTFSKGGSPIRKTTSIISIIKNATGFSLRGSNVKYELLTSPDTWPVDVDIGQMNQVISNLIINADQAMPGGGTIRIAISNVNLKKSEIFPLSAGKYVKISVIDEGEGISPKNLLKIFDPYFSTKEKGSGLGLAITYSIIKKHAGHITVDSIEGVGTNFTIYLKASEEPITDQEETKDTIKIENASILIMDDEPAVRNILTQMLIMMNHKVHATTNGEEALEAYKKAMNAKSPYDLTIMDLTIPGGMGGKEAIEKLLEIDPSAKAIVSSGYSNDPVIAEFKKHGFKGFLLKPYKLSELEAVLNNILQD